MATKEENKVRDLSREEVYNLLKRRGLTSLFYILTSNKYRGYREIAIEGSIISATVTRKGLLFHTSKPII